jgi:N-acetylmuramic acid 6-phosphate etherase
MQATTAELLVLGSALELALMNVLPQVLPAQILSTVPQSLRTPQDFIREFRSLLADLAQPQNVETLAAWVELERDIYRAGGRVTYFGLDALLDIFTDTTERSPTFMLPPFRKCDDRVSPVSWAFVKNPVQDTVAAWRQVLGRKPRCLDWDGARYEQLDGPANTRENPPRLSSEELLKFRIGNEADPSRYQAPDSAAIAVLVGEEARTLQSESEGWLPAFGQAAAPFHRSAMITIGTATCSWNQTPTHHIGCHLPVTPLRLLDRMAVKLALNTVSTATMGAMGRLVSNWMAHVDTSNKKLIDRGTRLVAELAGVDYPTACYALHETIDHLRTTVAPNQPRPSPVAVTIHRLQQSKSGG